MKNKTLYIFLFAFIFFCFNIKTNALDSVVVDNYRDTWLYFNGTSIETSSSSTSNAKYPNFSYKAAGDNALVCVSGENIPLKKGITCNYDSTKTNSDNSIGVAYLINDLLGVGGKASLSSLPGLYYWLELSTLNYLGAYDLETNLTSWNPTLTNQKTFNETQTAAQQYQNKYSNVAYTKEVQFDFNGETKIEFESGGDGYHYSQKIHVIDVNGNADTTKISLDNDNFELIEQDGYYLIKIADSKIGTTMLNVTLTVSGSYEYYKAQFFDCPDSYQDVMLTKTTKVYKEGSNSISGQIGKTSLTIKKVDKAGNFLPGAKLLIESETIDYRKEITTTNTEIILTDLPYGEYSITELSAPEGYIKSNEVKKVTLSNQNLSGIVTIQNNITKLTIKKLDENKEPLIGVVIKVESEENNYNKTFTTTNEDIVIEGLKYGKYVITEESTVEGYVLRKDPIEVTISEETFEEEVTIYNKLTRVEISKLGENKKNLPGATLEVQDKAGNIVKYCTDEKGNKNTKCKWVSTDKTYVIEGLPTGKYYLVETKAPEGYALNTKKTGFEVTDEDEVIKVTMQNKIRKVVISKINSIDKELLAGATLEVQDEAGNIVKYCTDEKGNKNTECKWVSTDKTYEIIGLPIGKYYLVETKSPEGYALNTQKIEFEVTETKSTIEVEMQNELEVKVPDTLSSRSTLLIAISMFDIALGIGIVTYVKKNKAQE